MIFYKFDGAGNDFILLDIRGQRLQLSPDVVAALCHRRFGIGADGLMTLQDTPNCDFEMRYYNSDGYLGSMCGNGGRCITAFAYLRQVQGSALSNSAPDTPLAEYHFMGYDGEHHGQLLEWDETTSKGMVRLGMTDVVEIRPMLQGWYLDTGSPHYVVPVQNLRDYDVYTQGRQWRYRADLFPEGTNVDFIEPQPDGTLHVRTYERGVENETYSCGTGVTAAALVYMACLQPHATEMNAVRIAAPGGAFQVECRQHGNHFSHIYLTGPVSLNFSGEVEFSKFVHSNITITEPAIRH